jgi:hypothetical protein
MGWQTLHDSCLADLVGKGENRVSNLGQLGFQLALLRRELFRIDIRFLL